MCGFAKFLKDLLDAHVLAFVLRELRAVAALALNDDFAARHASIYRLGVLGLLAPLGTGVILPFRRAVGEVRLLHRVVDDRLAYRRMRAVLVG